MKVFNNVLLTIIITILPSILFSQSIQKIEVEFSSTNKKKFRQGENIVLDAVITNNNHQDIAICYYSTAIIYSMTHDKNALELEELAPKDHERYNTERSHPDHTKSIPLDPGRGCEFNSYDNIFVLPRESYHYTVPINLCLHKHNCYGLKFILPEGQYEARLTLSPSVGGTINKTFAFEVIHANLDSLNILKDVFSTHSSQDIINFYNTCTDSILKDKLITSIRLHGTLDNPMFSFYISHISTISNQALLIYELSEFVNLFSYNDDRSLTQYNTTRLEVYKKILADLKTRDKKIANAFFAIVKSRNLHKESYNEFQKIPNDKIEALKND
jgi:hypothetical protein